MRQTVSVDNDFERKKLIEVAWIECNIGLSGCQDERRKP
jgi:hypothetical protein